GYVNTPSFTDESVSGHGSHASTPYQKACVNCHNGNNHQDGIYQDVFNVTAGTVSATGGLSPVYDKAAQTCSTVYCHSNANPRGGTTITITTPSWNGGKGTIIGTAGECGTCHSAASDPSPTWSASHTKHINGYGANPNFTCTACHAGTASGNSAIFGTMTARSLHTNGVKDVAFNSFANGGAWDSSSAACSNLYCHSNVQGSTGVGAPTSFTPGLAWNGPAVTCGSCHASMVKLSNISTATGSHKRHVQGYGYDCSSCHGAGYSATGNAVSVATHVDRVITIGFTGTAATNGATPSYYQGNNSPGNGYEYCSNVYCHSNVQGSGGVGVPSKFAAPVWGTGPVDCGLCHANMATSTAATGSHVKHAQTAGYSCPTCHNGAGKDPNPPFAATAKHADGTIEISFSGNAAGAAYSKGGGVAPGTGYGACSATNCHGQGAPTWGATSTAPVNGFPFSATQCTKCHGSAATNPFYSTAIPKVTINTDARVGAHTAHLVGTSNISNAIACSECHAVPGTVTAAGHMDGTIQVAFNGTLAKSQTTNATSCATTWCHGGNTTLLPQNSPARTAPVWGTPFATTSVLGTGGTAGTSGSGYCAQCHGYPPLTENHAGMLATDCIGCHPHVNSSGTGFTDPTHHINGLVETPGGHVFPYGGSLHLSAAGTTPWSSCTGCHSTAAGGAYPVAVGTAPICTGCHLQGLRAPSGTSSCWDCHGASATDGLPNGTGFPNVAGSHTIHAAITGTTCATCHNGGGTTTATHGSSNRVAATAASVKVAFTGQGANPLWTLASNTCSATNCHGQGAPTWGATSTAPVNGFPFSATQCTKCHGAAATNPFYSTAIPKVTINTDARVGAHTAHLVGTSNISNAIACSECHAVPGTVTAAGHMDGTI
ncbi:MAG: CxxxxCH/CxxCH domain-containing protein, partial [Desulfuromonadaceae bacterium]